jgi:glutamate dehydrogenase (NAD(P)+)
MQLDKRQQQLTFDSKHEKVIDEWGPDKILQVYDPDTGMKGVLVIDDTSNDKNTSLRAGTRPIQDIILNHVARDCPFYQ